MPLQLFFARLFRQDEMCREVREVFFYAAGWDAAAAMVAADPVMHYGWRLGVLAEASEE
jgi:hypothetical protein